MRGGSQSHKTMPRQNVLRTGVSLVISAFIPLIQGCRSPAPSVHGVQITQRDERLEIDLNGKRFTEYFFKNVPPLLLSGDGAGRVANDARLADEKFTR